MASVLIICAHADDEVLGVGGTVAKLSKEFNDVYLAILTDSVSSEVPKEQIERRKKQRIYQAQKAAKILGIKEVFFFDFLDMRLDKATMPQITEKIQECIEKTQPEIVFTHYHKDLNKDHRITSEATMVCLRPFKQKIKKIISFPIPYSSFYGNLPFYEFPNFFVDISDFFQQKKEAILAYEDLKKSQFSIEKIEDYCKFWGNFMSTKYAEPFYLIREIF